MELAVDPRLEADRPHPLDIARTRTEADAVQHVEDPSRFGQRWGDAQRVRRRRARGRGRAGAERRRAASCQRAKGEQGEDEAPHLGGPWPRGGRWLGYWR